MKSPSHFIGNSPIAQALRRLISTIANSAATVLITGESGTGKELLARSLHEQSDRLGGSFVPINCSAIPKELLESELFGHRKGSFTGAVADRIGRFELAHGGTIFLDEIGDMSLDMQVKLLRVLQERVIDPVGSTRQIPIDVRVIAATHRDLEVEIQAGRFREDLYYRLNVLPVVTPPLRERPQDIPELLNFYAARYKAPQSGAICFNPAFLDALVNYAWPGNVRELTNLMDRFSTLYAGQELDIRSIPPSLLPKGLHPLRANLSPAPLNRVETLSPPATDAFGLPEGLLEMDDQPTLEDREVENIIMLAQGLPSLPPEARMSRPDWPGSATVL